MLYRLRVGSGPRQNEIAPITHGVTFRVGRGRGADLKFPEDPYMSRLHFEIIPDAVGWSLKNLSPHGTAVAGAAIESERRLAPSDAIMAGSTLLVFEIAERGMTGVFPEQQAAEAIAAARAFKAAQVAVAAPKPAAAPAAPVAAPASDTGSTDSEDDEGTGPIPVVFLPGDSVELTAEELAGYDIFAGVPAKTIEGSIIKRHKINDQPPIWLRKYKPGEIICKEGDYGSTAFFITKGVVFIGIETPRKTRDASERGIKGFLRKISGAQRAATEDDIRAKPRAPRFIPVDAPVNLPYDQPVAELKAGDVFGEMSCMSFYPRSATCVAGPDGVEVLEMLRSVLDFVREKGKGAYKDRIEKNYRERTLDLAVRSVPLLCELPKELLDHLRPRISLVTFNPDTTICKEGDAADAFFLVRLGFVKVSQLRPGGEVVLQYLGPGDYFGEIGLIQGGARTATCTALDHVELIKIAKPDFDLMLKKAPEVAEGLLRGAQQMLAAQRRVASAPGGMPLGALLEKGLMNAQNLLLIDLDKCTRCDECVKACADSHGGVTRLIRDGLRVDKYLVATACRACADPVCMIGCPVGSIRRRNSLEILIEDWCIGCNKCAQQCPYGNITMHPYEKDTKDEDGRWQAEVVNSGKGRASTCDLCAGKGEPRCVYACPHGAASRASPVEFFATRLPMAKG